MIEPKDIAVFMSTENCVQRLPIAAALAERWRAHLIAIFLVPPAHTTLADEFAIGSTAIGDMLARQTKTEHEREAAAKAGFDELLERHDLDGEWRLSRNESREQVILHARHAALTVVGPPDSDFVEFESLSLCGDVVLGSGRPTLLVPSGWRSASLGRRIVVGWNGSREATRAIADAMPFLVKAEAVSVVVIDEEKTRQRLQSEEPGLDMCRHLARYGVPVSLERAPEGPAGEILLDAAERFGADLLVMGAYGQSRVSELIFGGATRTMLHRSDRPVLLSQ